MSVWRRTVHSNVVCVLPFFLQFVNPRMWFAVHLKWIKYRTIYYRGLNGVDVIVRADNYLPKSIVLFILPKLAERRYIIPRKISDASCKTKKNKIIYGFWVYETNLYDSTYSIGDCRFLIVKRGNQKKNCDGRRRGSTRVPRVNNIYLHNKTSGIRILKIDSVGVNGKILYYNNFRK